MSRAIRKNGIRGFRPAPTQTGLFSRRRWLEARTFGFRKLEEVLCSEKEVPTVTRS